MPPSKYDLEDRLLEYAATIVRLVERLPKTRAGNHVGGQLLRSGTSPLFNHGEAQAAESQNDFVHKLRICLKELRESQRALRLILKVPLVTEPQETQAAHRETDELIRTFVPTVGHAPLPANKSGCSYSRSYFVRVSIQPGSSIPVYLVSCPGVTVTTWAHHAHRGRLGTTGLSMPLNGHQAAPQLLSNIPGRLPPSWTLLAPPRPFRGHADVSLGVQFGVQTCHGRIDALMSLNSPGVASTTGGLPVVASDRVFC